MASTQAKKRKETRTKKKLPTLPFGTQNYLGFLVLLALRSLRTPQPRHLQDCHKLKTSPLGGGPQKTSFLEANGHKTIGGGVKDPVHLQGEGGHVRDPQGPGPPDTPPPPQPGRPPPWPGEVDVVNIYHPPESNQIIEATGIRSTYSSPGCWRTTLGPSRSSTQSTATSILQQIQAVAPAPGWGAGRGSLTTSVSWLRASSALGGQAKPTGALPPTTVPPLESLDGSSSSSSPSSPAGSSSPPPAGGATVSASSCALGSEAALASLSALSRSARLASSFSSSLTSSFTSSSQLLSPADPESSSRLLPSSMGSSRLPRIDSSPILCIVVHFSEKWPGLLGDILHSSGHRKYPPSHYLRCLLLPSVPRPTCCVYSCMLSLLLPAASIPSDMPPLGLHSLLRNQLLPAVRIPTCCVYSYLPRLLLRTWHPSVYAVYSGTSFYLLSLLLPAVSTPTCGVYSYMLGLLLLTWCPSVYAVHSGTSFYLLSLLLPAAPTPTRCVYSYLLCLLLLTWLPSVYAVQSGTSFYLLSLLLPAVSTPNVIPPFSLHSLLRSQLLPAAPIPTCCVYSYMLHLLLLTWHPSVRTVHSGTSFYLLSLLLPAVSTPSVMPPLSLHSLPRNQLLPAERIPTCCVYSYLPRLLLRTWHPSVYAVYSGTSFYLLSLLLPAVSTLTCGVYSYLLGLLLLTWHPSVDAVHPGTSFYLLSLLLPDAPTPTRCVYSYLLYLLLLTWHPSVRTAHSGTSFYLLSLLLPDAPTPTRCVYSYLLCLLLLTWHPSVRTAHSGTSFYLLSLLLPTVPTPTVTPPLSLHSLTRNQLLPAVYTPTCGVYSCLLCLILLTWHPSVYTVPSSGAPPEVTRARLSWFQFSIERVCTYTTASGVKQHWMPQGFMSGPIDRTTLGIPYCPPTDGVNPPRSRSHPSSPPRRCSAPPSSTPAGSLSTCSEIINRSLITRCTLVTPRSPASVRDDGKLGGLGHATLGRSTMLPCGSPSPPLLHEDKLSGPGSGGPEVVRLRQEGKLTLRHEVKLSESREGIAKPPPRSKAKSSSSCGASAEQEDRVSGRPTKEVVDSRGAANQEIFNSREAANQEIFNSREAANQEIFNSCGAANQEIFNLCEAANQEIFKFREARSQEIINSRKAANQEISISRDATNQEISIPREATNQEIFHCREGEGTSTLFIPSPALDHPPPPLLL